MRKKTIEFIKMNFYPLIIVTITIILAWTNYKPNTFLSGWDTLHPEFDFSLNFKRIIDGVWREEQGLGAVAGHSHMSELPRYIILYPFSFVFSVSFLRYFYVFLCLTIGPIGMFYFLNYLIKNKSSAFLGSLFYIFNQSVLQQFYVPFEMFVTYYASIPWFFLFSTRFIKERKKKDLIFFSVVSFLGMPIAYAAQLWYVNFFLLVVYVFFLVKATYGHFFAKTIIFLISITLFINSFWLLPQIYFLLHSAYQVTEAHINQLFSERMFSINKEFGRLSDVAILRGPLNDWTQFSGDKFVFLFGDFRNFLNNPLILAIGYLGFGVICFGIIKAILKKEKALAPFFPVFLISLLFLINMNPPFSFLFSAFRTYIPLFEEAFRSPYTKFSFIALFTYSLYFAYANKIIVGKLSRVFKGIYIVFVSMLLVVYMLPFFSGQLIDPYLKIKIPENYFKMFSWFKTQPADSRIASLPDHNFWGWEYYRFGYQGAGFLWFGIQQPVLVRDFDRWNSNNENFYWEISYALYSQNLELFEKVLEKYQVSFLLVDENVISPDNPKSLYFEKTEELLANSGKISLEKTFGKIKIYKVALPYQINDFKFTVENSIAVASNYKWSSFDKTFIDNGIYYSEQSAANSQPSIVYYPFRSLFTGRTQADLEFNIEEKENLFIIKPKEEKENSSLQLIMPEESQELVEVDKNDLSKIAVYQPEVSQVDGKKRIFFPKINGLYSYNSVIDGGFFEKELSRCDQFRNGPIDRYIVTDNNGVNFLRFSSQNSSNCLDIELSNLPHNLSYLIKVESRNIKGKSLLFSTVNQNSRKSEIETYLPEEKDNLQNNKNPKVNVSYFVIPPMEPNGLGYTLHFDNISIGSDETINDLGKVTVQPFPYKFLTGFKFESTVYSLDKNSILVYSQSFDSGWHAYRIQNSESRIQNWLNNTLPFLFGK